MIRLLIVAFVAANLSLDPKLSVTAESNYLDLYSTSNFPTISKLFLANNNKIGANTGLSGSELKSIELESLPIVNKDNLTPGFTRSTCQLVQIVHLLHQAGCQPKAISSFACAGSCSSYVQVSTSKFWQHERSCSCCQQTGLQEATFTLNCPSLDPPYKKVKTYAPVNCLCRACTDLGRENLQPQELVEALAEARECEKNLSRCLERWRNTKNRNLL